MNNEFQNPRGPHSSQAQEKPANNWLKILAIVLIACVVSTLVALGAVYLYLFPGAFKPVTLSASEEQVLEKKLNGLNSSSRTQTLHQGRIETGKNKGLQPERYSETEASREIILFEHV